MRAVLEVLVEQILAGGGRRTRWLRRHGPEGPPTTEAVAGVARRTRWLRRPNEAALRGIGAVFLAFLLPASAVAQLSTPTQWRWITDTPAELVTGEEVPDTAWRFVAMPPGWHVTTGPGAVLFEPAYLVKGRFRVETEIFLFPDACSEGFGIMVGDDRLESDSPSYVSFLIRNDGSAGVFRVRGRLIEPIVDWARHESIRQNEGDEAVANVLELRSDGSELVFTVNGTSVARVPSDVLPREGPVGFRIGAGLNLHITTLDLTYTLAPTPPD